MQLFEALQTHIENKVLTEAFVEEAYICLFNSDLTPHTEGVLNTEMSVIRLHPVHVIYSLASCLRALPEGSDFIEIRNEANAHIAKMVAVEEETKIALFPVVEFFKEQGKDHHLIELVNNCPLYTAKEWFGGMNRNLVFTLRTEELNPEWVFKLAHLEKNKNMSDIRDCEHYAFKINMNGQFPLPAVFLIEVRGALGTLQPVVPRTMEFEDIPDNKRVLILPSLRKLLLFDLLFLNHDRSVSNILYCQEKDSYTCYGIDHEDSLKYLHGAYTISQIELIKFLSDGLRFEDFDTAIQEVCSQKSCDHYQQILKECFASSDRLDQSTKYSFETESEQALLERINDVDRRLRESNKDLSKTIDDIQKEMRINPQAGSKSPSQSDPSHLSD